MLAAERSAGVTSEVNLRNSLYTSDKARKQGLRPGFETQGRCHQKSKTGPGVSAVLQFFFSKWDKLHTQ